MKRPLVSIGISFRNPGRHFREALQSVFSQEFAEWELLLMDDGSTDGAVELAKELADERVRVCCDGRREGLAARINQMAREAQGQYFLRMDADDVMHPKRCRRQYEFLEGCSAETVVGTMAYSLSDSGEVLGLRYCSSDPEAGFGARRSFIHPTVAARTAWFQENPYNGHPIFHRSEDAELWCRAQPKSKYEVMKEPLLYYREGNSAGLEPYIGSVMGGIALLATRYREPKIQFFRHLVLETGKLVVTCMAAGTPAQGWIEGRKFSRLRAPELAQAESDLDRVRQTELPLRSVLE